MSPEQTLKLSIDHRSDLFSLGVLLYVMLTGVSPFDHGDVFVVLDKIRNHQVPSVKTVRPDTPTWLSDLVDSLLEKHPDHRVQSADAVASSLLSRNFPHLDSSPLSNFFFLEVGNCCFSNLPWFGSRCVSVLLPSAVFTLPQTSK